VKQIGRKKKQGENVLTREEKRRDKRHSKGKRKGGGKGEEVRYRKRGEGKR